MEERNEQIKAALNSIHSAIVFHSRDRASNKRDAWIYGVMAGWDEESIEEIKEDFGWGEDDVKRMNSMRQAVREVIGI